MAVVQHNPGNSPPASDGQRLLVASVRDLVTQRIAPRAAAIDASAEFPWDIVNVFRAQGLLGMSIPEEYGGAALSLLDMCLVYAEIARTCLTSSVTLADQKLGADALVRYGSESLKQQFLPSLATGERLIAFALTEPDAGSDVAALSTVAERDGGAYVLNGRKCFITNGGVADLYTVFASTQPERRGHGLSCFVVPSDTPGLSVGRLERKMGLRGSPTSELIFDDCRVPAEYLVGREGDGFTLAMSAMIPARVVVAFQAVGLAEGALDFAGAYVARRRQFGRAVIDFQGIQFMLADMSTSVDAARYLAQAAATACDQGTIDASRLAAEAKTFASDAAMKITTDAVQLLGGYGCTGDFPVERMMRDAKILQIFDGTNQIQRIVIGRELGHRWRPG